MKLLDTDVMIDILRNDASAVSWLGSLGDEEIALPGFVVMELLKGGKNKTDVIRIRQALEDYTVLWPDESDCNRALSDYANARLSHNIGAFDALIAELAIGQSVPLYTFNVKHFNAISNLQTIQPYQRK